MGLTPEEELDFERNKAKYQTVSHSKNTIGSFAKNFGIFIMALGVLGGLMYFSTLGPFYAVSTIFSGITVGSLFMAIGEIVLLLDGLVKS